MKHSMDDLNKSNTIDDLVEIIKEYYSEYHRFYHGIQHIEDGVKVAIHLSLNGEAEFDLNITQAIAWFFHDIVYIPGSKENEKQSVEMMKNILTRPTFSHLLAHEEIDLASSIIMSTVEHKPLCEEAKPIIDMDLHLFSDANKLNIATENLIKEFNFENNRDKFIEGQKDFLKRHILNKEQIYYTRYGINNWESKARENLIKHIS